MGKAKAESKEKVKADHVEGIDFVRPPLLDMKKIKESPTSTKIIIKIEPSSLESSS